MPPQPCTKVKYASPVAAMEDAIRITLKTAGKYYFNSTYQCNECNAWHLTSKFYYQKFEAVQKENEQLRADLMQLRKDYKWLQGQHKTLTLNFSSLKKLHGSNIAEIRKDEVVKRLEATIAAHNKKLAQVREVNSQLITKNIQLEKQLAGK